MSVPTATLLDDAKPNCSSSDENFFKHIAPFTQALMLEMLPDRFDHWPASACRLRF
jgi:hypothetical protein